MNGKMNASVLQPLSTNCVAGGIIGVIDQGVTIGNLWQLAQLTNSGPIAATGTASPTELVAGGGIRNRDDLIRLADAGCDGALVATALIEGRLTTSDLIAAREHRGPVQRHVEDRA